MEYLPDYFVPLIIAAMHLLLSFNLKLPDKYKNKFRMYSVIVNFLFMIFIGFFVNFSSSWLFTARGPDIYLYSLFMMYFLLTIPFAVVLAFRFYTFIMNLHIHSIVLKGLIIGTVLIILAGIIIIGMFFFVFFFYFSGILFRLPEDVYAKFL